MPNETPIAPIPEDLRELYRLQKSVKRSFRSDEDAVGTAQRLMELIERVSRAEAERDDLARWKKEMMAVDSTWDPQEVGKELGVLVGQSIRPAILPAITALRLRCERLASPVSDEEWATTKTWPKGLWRDHLDALLAARKEK